MPHTFTGEAGEDAKGRVDPRVDVAVTRTEVVWDRTLPAWPRTAIALMGAAVAFDNSEGEQNVA